MAGYVPGYWNADVAHDWDNHLATESKVTKNICINMQHFIHKKII